MRLVDLKPKWMRLNGEAVSIIFLCPRCVARGPKGCQGRGQEWLTCTFKVMPGQVQRELIAEVIEANRDHFGPDLGDHDVVACKSIAWKRTSKLLETMSVTPSLDASRAGHWHGWIKNGNCEGDLV